MAKSPPDSAQQTDHFKMEWNEILGEVICKLKPDEVKTFFTGFCSLSLSQDTSLAMGFNLENANNDATVRFFTAQIISAWVGCLLLDSNETCTEITANPPFYSASFTRQDRTNIWMYKAPGFNNSKVVRSSCPICF